MPTKRPRPLASAANLHRIADPAWQHPAQAIEADPEADSRGPISDVVRDLICMTVPPIGKAVGIRRGVEAGYLRYIALLYITAPELFAGRSQRQLAADMGVDHRSLDRAIDHVRAAVAKQAAKGK